MIRFIITSFLLGMTLAASPLAALEIPPRPQGYVSDRAGLLSTNIQQELESLLSAYEQQTSNQVIVATFPSLEGDSIESFSIRLAEKWKVGQKGRDNGVIFLIFPNDRQTRIETGYGLEGVLPDAAASQILRKAVLPLFGAGEYEKGIFNGVLSILKTISGETENLPRESVLSLPWDTNAIEPILWGLLVLFLITDGIRYLRYVRGNRHHEERYNFWEWFFRFALTVLIFTLMFRMIFYGLLLSRGGYYGSRGGFGGFPGGGGGGGRFGGGGASGRWS